jgi:hypothetical protein
MQSGDFIGETGELVSIEVVLDDTFVLAGVKPMAKIIGIAIWRTATILFDLSILWHITSKIQNRTKVL